MFAVEGHSLRSYALMAWLISYNDVLKIVSFPVLPVWKKQDSAKIYMYPANGHCGGSCGPNIPFPRGYTSSRHCSVTPWTVTGASRQYVVPYCEQHIIMFNAKCTAIWCNQSQGIPRSIGLCPRFVTNMGNYSLWSWISIPTLALCLMSPDSKCLPSMTLILGLSCNSSNGIWWWRAKSGSIYPMPEAPQPMSTCVSICWLFTVNVQVITKCFSSIVSSDTSTLLTERCKIAKHLKAFKAILFLSTKTPSILNWPNHFPVIQKLTWFLLGLRQLQLPSSCASAKVQMDYRLRHAHTHTRAAHSKLPGDPCATRSL